MPRGKLESRSGSTSRIQRGLEHRAGWWDRVLDLPVLWGAVAVLACTWLLLPRVGRQVPTWAPGDVAAFDVVVSRDLSLPDETATEALREEARSQVLPVYDLEPRLQFELADGIGTLFAACRSQLAENDALDPEALVASTVLRVQPTMVRVLSQAECGGDVERALQDMVARLYRQRIVDDRRGLEQRGERGVTLRDLATGNEHVVSLGELGDVLDLRSGVETTARTWLLEYDVIRRGWIKPTVEFLDANLSPNLVFNRAETAQRVRLAAAQVSERSQVFRRGQILVRRGDTVTPAVARTLGLMSAQRHELATFTSAVGAGLVVLLMVIAWWLLLPHFGSSAEIADRLSMIFLLMIACAAIDRLGLFVASAVALNSQSDALSLVQTYLWGLPWATGSVVVALLLGLQPAVLFAVWGSVAAAILLGGDFSMLVFALASGLVGALAVQRYRERSLFTRIGAVVGATNVVVLAILLLYQGAPLEPTSVSLAALFAFLGGPLAVGSAGFLLPALEKAFGITTDQRLLELSNQNLPLLKRLSLEAPGTYQHSLTVGNLAEAGAEAVGANALLLRVCSYYHDVGKLVKPEYFVENQRGANPHDNLSPSMSALVIMSHVKEGLEIAGRHKLPLPIRQAIATHHGTKLIRFFYSRARDRITRDTGEVRESDYRYPGPKPHTKELGVLLLADAVEAAARTIDNPAPAKIQNMIDRIFTDALEDGQLDETELTFSELDKIANAFLWVLTNMYHHRVDYPGFDFNRRHARDSGPVRLGAKAVTTGG